MIVRTFVPVLVPLSGLAALLAAPAFAAPIEASVEADVKLGYDINPFLESGSDLAAPYVEAAIRPSLTKRTEKGQVSLSGHFARTEYLEKYGATDRYGVDLEAQQRLTPKLSAFGALSYDSDVVGFDDDSVTGVPDNTDVNLIGQRRRAQSASASGGLQYQVSPKDTVSVNGSYTKTDYRNGPAGNDNDVLGGSIGWNHAISARTKIGVSGSYYRIDYDTAGLMTTIMQPAVTFSTELSATWHFDASLGVSFSDLHLPSPLADRHSKGLSGSINLCHKGLKDDFCVFGDRSVSASGAGGTAERTQIGASYNRRLSERLGVSASAAYTNSDSQAQIIGNREFVTARAGLDWRVSRRLKVGAQARYRDVFGQTLPVKADLGAELFATVALPGSK